MIRRFSTLAALAVIGLAAPASAQMAQPGQPGMMMSHDMGPPSAEMAKAMADKRAQQARDMHVILRLRPDQEAAWRAYEAAMAPADHQMMMMDGSHGSPATTPERLDMMSRHMAQMEAFRAKHDAAIRAFYAALSPDQQQVFDALERMRGPHGAGHGGQMMMMMMGGQHPPMSPN
ncbi:MAG TPA: Spy/CpxP family protein refolding chaperone [Phenylobacterium sp.]|nr:Spy/CpxP family protein refolding chaperone [Phenylobacterium sp.]